VFTFAPAKASRAAGKMIFGSDFAWDSSRLEQLLTNPNADS